MTELRADCARCFGLCCVAPAFARSADFALDKPAGQPCVNLLADHRCGIHDSLRERGFPGCTVYDCFGAGQRVAASYGRDWRAAPETAPEMFAAFERMRDLHELLWYLTDALARPATAALHDGLRAAIADTERLATTEPTRARTDAQRTMVDEWLTKASAVVRGKKGRNLRGADLAGHDLAGADLRGAHLRGALLIGADLTGADLAGADVIGADLRGARVGGADLATTLYLTRFQVNAARGDARTKLPATLDRPSHWTT